MEGIKVFSPLTCKGSGDNFVENVVYHELLDGSVFRPQPMHTNFDTFYFEDQSDDEFEMHPC